MKGITPPLCLLFLNGHYFSRGARLGLDTKGLDMLLTDGTSVVIHPIKLEQRVYVWDDHMYYMGEGRYQGGKALGVIKRIMDPKRGVVEVLYDDQDSVVEEYLCDIRIDEENTPVPVKEQSA